MQIRIILISIIKLKSFVFQTSRAAIIIIIIIMHTPKRRA